ncbi:MAG: hypothetical protein J2P37_05245 [Ktedonobacteraceae bacterium]|nr:hypothetical protein [Ktedonobacteraceae bacterium]MBO0790734.1 hypothetical protein [Ktedonobacteraceae bacterium]
MNSTLIIGGLFGLGLLSLIGLIFAARGERRPHRETPTATPRVEEAAEQAVTPGVNRPSEAPVSQALPQQQQWLTASDGQLQELSFEIKSLHRQAQEIEQRLGLVTEIVGRIESSDRNRATRIEEELPRTPGST